MNALTGNEVCAEPGTWSEFELMRLDDVATHVLLIDDQDEPTGDFYAFLEAHA